MLLTSVCGTGPVQQADQQAAIRGAADEYEDKDGDLVMAEEDVEQLVASLQAARHACSEWESMGGPSSISMLLFGHQVKHLQCCQGPSKDPALLLHLHCCMPCCVRATKSSHANLKHVAHVAKTAAMVRHRQVNYLWVTNVSQHPEQKIFIAMAVLYVICVSQSQPTSYLNRDPCTPTCPPHPPPPFLALFVPLTHSMYRAAGYSRARAVPYGLCHHQTRSVLQLQLALLIWTRLKAMACLTMMQGFMPIYLCTNNNQHHTTHS